MIEATCTKCCKPCEVDSIELAWGPYDDGTIAVSVCCTAEVDFAESPLTKDDCYDDDDLKGYQYGY